MQHIILQLHVSPGRAITMVTPSFECLWKGWAPLLHLPLSLSLSVSISLCLSPCLSYLSPLLSFHPCTIVWLEQWQYFQATICVFWSVIKQRTFTLFLQPWNIFSDDMWGIFVSYLWKRISNNGLLTWLNDALQKKPIVLFCFYGFRSSFNHQRTVYAEGSESCGYESRAVKQRWKWWKSHRLFAAGFLLFSLPGAVGCSADPAMLSHHVCPMHICWSIRKINQVPSQCGLHRYVPELPTPSRTALLELVICHLLSPKTPHSEPCMCQHRRHQGPASSGEK